MQPLPHFTNRDERLPYFDPHLVEFSRRPDIKDERFFAFVENLLKFQRADTVQPPFPLVFHQMGGGDAVVTRQGFSGDKVFSEDIIPINLHRQRIVSRCLNSEMLVSKSR